MSSRRCAAFTWMETLIALCLLTFLLFFVSMPPHHTSGRYSQFTETVSQMRKLHLTTQMMALDGTTTGNTNLAWPGSQDGTFSTWAKALVPAYLSTNEFCRLLSASNFPVDPRSLPTGTPFSFMLSPRNRTARSSFSPPQILPIHPPAGIPSSPIPDPMAPTASSFFGKEVMVPYSFPSKSPLQT